MTHRSNTATGYCAQCHKPYCGDCVVEALGASFCGAECREAYIAFQCRYQDKPRRSTAFVWLVQRLIPLALAVTLGYGVYRFMNTRAGRQTKAQVERLLVKPDKQSSQ